MNAATHPTIDPNAALVSLHLQGANHFDPVRFHFLEALARRLPAHQGPVRGLLEEKFSQALHDYQARFEQAQAASYVDLRPVARPCPLADVNRYLRQHPLHQRAGEVAENSGAATELKAIRYFRPTWSQRRVDRQLSQALARSPQNAGPLNSHLLLLRALTLLRDSAPDYLNHFMVYADALLWLEQVEQSSKPVAKHASVAEGRKKAKALRSKSG